MDAATIQAVAALGAVMVAAAGLLAGFVYWLHRELKQDLLSEIHRVESKSDRNIEDLREEMRRNNEELREEVRRNNEELREEVRRGFEEQAAQMRRNHAVLLSALNGHTHNSDTGAAVFHELPAPSDDD